jgi:hypothetical protein
MADEVLDGSCLCGALSRPGAVHAFRSLPLLALPQGHGERAREPGVDRGPGSDAKVRPAERQKLRHGSLSHMRFARGTAQPGRPARRHTRRIARFYPQRSADCPHLLGVPDAMELRGGRAASLSRGAGIGGGN